MNNDIVSIVVASYNMGDYIGLTIESILKQTYQSFELIIIDDGSTDNTPDQVAQFLHESNIKYIKQENQGQPKAKNRGIREASGKYIAFCDADDIWTPDKLELQLQCFANNTDIGVVYSEVSYIDGEGSPITKEKPYERHQGVITEQLILKNFIPFGTAMVKKECFDTLGLFDENLPMGIDWDLWLRFSLKYKFYYLEKQTYIYRIWPGQMSSNYRGRYKNAFLIMNKFIESNPGALKTSVIKKAWADTHTNRAIAIARAEKKIIEPLQDLIKALSYDPLFINAWKGMIKVVLKVA